MDTPEPKLSQSPPLHHWRLPSGLQVKLILPYVVLTLLVAMVGTYIVTRLVTTSIRERFVNQMAESSRVAADAVVRREGIQLDNLRLMTFTTGVNQAFSSQNAEQLETLLVPLAVNNRVDLVTALNPDGQAFFSFRTDDRGQAVLEPAGGDYSSYALVSDVLAGREDSFGDKFVQLLETDQGPVLFTSAPVLDGQEQLVGVLLVGTRLENLATEMQGRSSANVVLLSPEGRLLATTSDEPAGGYPVYETAARQLADNEADTYDLQINNRPYQVYYTNLIVRGQVVGQMGVVLPYDFLVATESTNRNTFSAVFAIGTIGVICLGYFLSQSIARPIRQLAKMSQAVAAGDLDQRSGLKQQDEIGELAAAFDSMTADLKARTEETERLYAEAIRRNQELAEMNERLKSTQLQLIQSEKLAAIGQLTAGIVHDVKNPLTVILGMAELLLEEPDLTSMERHQLEVMRDSTVKANRIVTDLLKFSRQTQSEMICADLRETIAVSLRLTAYLAKQSHTTIQLDVPDGPVQVLYDPHQIEQVLINMIHNAMQAMGKYGTLQIRLREEGKMAVLTIQDSGTGIAPEHLSRIFDPFFTTKPEGEGTGLGLSVSYGIVANHNGRIEVQSELGVGTTFSIYLPLAYSVQSLPTPELPLSLGEPVASQD